MRRVLPIIYGSTSVGKTNLGLKLAERFDGQIISADSRQVYKFLDIGTGKDIPPGSKFHSVVFPVDLYKKLNRRFTWGYFLFGKTKVWLLDLVNPHQDFSSVEWSILASRLIKDIFSLGSLPIIVGGSAFYIKTLIDGLDYFGVAGDVDLRDNLESKTVLELQKEVAKIWPEKLKSMNRSDFFNSRRLIRAIEVGISRHKYSKKKFIKKDISVLGIGLFKDLDLIKKNIHLRVQKRIDKGLVKEIQSLLSKGYGWDSPGLNSLAYKEFADFYKQKISFKQSVDQWYKDEVRYARKQLLWFKNDQRFSWFDVSEKGFENKIIQLIATKRA